MAEVLSFPNAAQIEPSLTDPPPQTSRELILELEHEIADLQAIIVSQALSLRKAKPWNARLRSAAAVLTAFGIGWMLPQPMEVFASSAPSLEEPVVSEPQIVPAIPNMKTAAAPKPTRIAI